MWIPRSVPFRRQPKFIRFTLHVLPFGWFSTFYSRTQSFSSFVRFSVACAASSSLCARRFRTYPLLPCLSSGAPYSLRVRLPSPPRRSLASHTRPLQRNSNVFSFGVHLSTQLPGFVSLALVSLERFVVASPSFWCWCAWRRKEIFWNLSPSAYGKGVL